MSLQKIFNVVEFKQSIDEFPLWKNMIDTNFCYPLFEDNNQLLEKICWKDFKRECSNLPSLKLLNKVNSFWNSKVYIADKPKQDYWKCPYEFNIFGGDCEDYSIVKYFTLKELGIDNNLMKILVLQNTINKLGHAVLIVDLDDTTYVLDNLKTEVSTLENYSDYEPKYSVNELNKWIYVKVKK